MEIGLYVGRLCYKWNEFTIYNFSKDEDTNSKVKSQTFYFAITFD